MQRLRTSCVKDKIKEKAGVLHMRDAHNEITLTTVLIYSELYSNVIFIFIYFFGRMRACGITEYNECYVVHLETDRN